MNVGQHMMMGKATGSDVGPATGISAGKVTASASDGGKGEVTAAAPRKVTGPDTDTGTGTRAVENADRAASPDMDKTTDSASDGGLGEVTAAAPRNGCNILTPLHLLLLGRDLPFRPCCDEHDLFYEQGGPASHRAFADRLFRECIHAAGYPAAAWLCWCGVRLFGWLYWA